MIAVQLNSNSDIIYPKFKSYQNNFAANGLYTFASNYRVSINLNLFESNGCMVMPHSFRVVNIGNSSIYVYYNGHKYSIISGTEISSAINASAILVFEGQESGSFTYEINASFDLAALYKR